MEVAIDFMAAVCCCMAGKSMVDRYGIEEAL